MALDSAAVRYPNIAQASPFVPEVLHPSGAALPYPVDEVARGCIGNLLSCSFNLVGVLVRLARCLLPGFAGDPVSFPGTHAFESKVMQAE